MGISCNVMRAFCRRDVYRDATAKWMRDGGHSEAALNALRYMLEPFMQDYLNEAPSMKANMRQDLVRQLHERMFLT
jgi:hypothetical protein